MKRICFGDRSCARLHPISCKLYGVVLPDTSVLHTNLANFTIIYNFGICLWGGEALRPSKPVDPRRTVEMELGLETRTDDVSHLEIIHGLTILSYLELYISRVGTKLLDKLHCIESNRSTICLNATFSYNL